MYHTATRRCRTILFFTLIAIAMLPAAPVKLSLGAWGGTADIALYNQAIRQFKAANPDIDVELVSTPDFLSFVQKLQTMLAGGVPPDVITLGNEWIQTFAAKGVFVDLGPLIQADPEVKLDAYWPIAINTLTFGGKLYALPKDMGVDGLYYNKKLFDKAGVKYPDNNWLWADLLAAAQKLTVRDASGRTLQYGWADSGQNMWPWVWQNGGSFFDAERNPTKCTMTDPAVVEAMQFYFELSLKHKVAPNIAELQQVPFRDLFMSGRAAMVYDTVAAQASYGTIKDFEWGVSEMAIGRQRAVGMTENGWLIIALTKNLQPAWKLVKWLSSAQGAVIFTTGSGTLPALKAVASTARQPFLDGLAYARPLFTSPRMLELLSVFQAELPAMAMGQKPVKDVLESMTAKFNAILAQK
jgi:multiple sugar transport system substrate-binding protein